MEEMDSAGTLLHLDDRGYDAEELGEFEAGGRGGGRKTKALPKVGRRQYGGGGSDGVWILPVCFLPAVF